jgi:prepilin-type N-terminal cleavage/methylation domain-containing protein/prepilin-type processing-associated H-X9-DG protein
MQSELRNGGFTLVELLVVVAIIAILMAILLPALSMAREKARQATCMGQLKDVGVAMFTWSQNAGGFPTWDLPPSHHPWMTGPRDALNGWPELLGMVEEFTAEELAANRDAFEAAHFPVEDFTKAVDNMDVFMCPSDNPHPHRINHDRSVGMGSWELDAGGYKQSYGMNPGCSKTWMNNRVYNGRSFTETGDLEFVDHFHKNASGQVLCSDGLWTWMTNFSGFYIDNPNASWNFRSWRSNVVGYFHGNATTANVCFCDGSVRSVKWGNRGSGIDSSKTFFWGTREEKEGENGGTGGTY